MRSTIQGYAAKGIGQELEPFSYEPPELKENEVRVSVTHCGLCYSDIYSINDQYGVTEYPFVPGHEIVGHVSEVGPSVTGLSKGERVGIGWQGRSCTQCEWCLKGDEHLCNDVATNGVWTPYGGFSSSVTAEGRFAYPLPAYMPSEVAAALLCAGITVYVPLRSCTSGKGRKVGIVGVGGLGHLALQYARAFDLDVTAISSSPDKEEQAMAFGADHFMLVRDKADLKDKTFSFDMLLFTGHSSLDWIPLQRTLRNNGKLVMVGFSPEPVAFESVDLVVHQQSFIGSFLGNRAMMREMLDFSQEHGIKPVIETMPMSQVNEAIRKVKENRARYRIVLVNE